MSLLPEIHQEIREAIHLVPVAEILQAMNSFLKRIAECIQQEGA